MINLKKAIRILLIIIGLFFLLPILSITYSAIASADTTKDDDSAITEEFSFEQPLVYTLTIEGAIGTVTVDRVEIAIERAYEDNAALLVIMLDTPGGFSNATRSINKEILNSKVPVCVYVYPSGAHSGSAGVYITYAAHFAAMASSTNIGSAHPVSGDGKEIDSIMNEKVTNDAVAQIRSCAQKRGRNIEWAEKAVRESVSITDIEALEMNVINFRAENLHELLEQIDGKETELPQGKVIMRVKNAKTVDLGITWFHAILDVITNPNMVFILLSIGGLGITLELYNPGSIFPGVVGVISLILAFYGMQTLPINYAGVALMIVALILFIAEIKVVSHGLLTLGGLVALFLGGLMLVDTVDPTLQVSKTVLITVVIVVGFLVGITGWLVIKAARNRPFIGREGMHGKVAVVRKNGFVYVDGALWKMESADKLEIGDKVEILGMDNLILKVKKIIQ